MMTYCCAALVLIKVAFWSSLVVFQTDFKTSRQLDEDPASKTLSKIEQAIRCNQADELKTILSSSSKDKLLLAKIAKLLARVSNDEDCDVAILAINGLVQIGSSSSHSLCAFLHGLRHDSSAVRIESLGALEKCFSHRSDVVPSVMSALKDRDPMVRGRAASALGSMKSQLKRISAALEPCLLDNDSLVRVEAASSLWRIDRENADKVVPVLLQVLKQDKGYSARLVAISALKTIGSRAKAAAPALIALLQDSTFGNCRGFAALSLVAIAPDDESTITVLVKLLEDEDGFVCGCSGHGLRRIGKKSIPVLIRVFQQLNPNARQLTAQILGSFGPEAKAAIQTLEQALGDPDRHVRKQAEKALESIKRK